jgi:hypothetical protein
MTTPSPADDGRFPGRLHQRIDRRAWRQPTVEEYSQVVTVYTPEQMPVLSALPRGFPTFDHWFCDVSRIALTQLEPRERAPAMAARAGDVERQTRREPAQTGMASHRSRNAGGHGRRRSARPPPRPRSHDEHRDGPVAGASDRHHCRLRQRRAQLHPWAHDRGGRDARGAQPARGDNRRRQHAFVQAAARRRGRGRDDPVLAELTAVRVELAQLRISIITGTARPPHPAPEPGPPGTGGNA